MNIKKLRLLIIFLLAPLFPIFADDDAIVPFDESWAINISAKYVTTNFSPEDAGYYTTDRPWAMGLGLRYKNISAALLLPSFYAFDEHPFESFDIQLASYYDFIYYEAFCKQYQDFSDGKVESKNVLHSL